MNVKTLRLLAESIENCRREQVLARDYILENGPDCLGAHMGLQDWLMEEILILESVPPYYVQELSCGGILDK